MAHRVTLIPGDGTGPELTEASRRVLEATGVDFEWDVQPAGEAVMAEHGGNPLPESTLESIRRNGVALKGPITTPIGEGFRSVNVELRKRLDLYAQVRSLKNKGESVDQVRQDIHMEKYSDFRQYPNYHATFADNAGTIYDQLKSR